ncbi:hypothetical protein BLA29_002481 [Euroglyphus maynei]|uniref:Uncharacterized protein n=1 Tax=Euroglyphus maynei TaxID=6958 RepID=A0A1Y3BFI2_EURMA|nr:hypothetical protein BLA29_002481 [Euroglyphus maynei]
MLNPEDLCKREIIRGFFEELLQQNLFECKVYSFGSTTSGLSIYNSDIDFHVRLYLPDGQIRRLNKKQAKTPLMAIRKIFRAKLDRYFLSIFIDASCPIVKLNSAFTHQTKLSCDLNVTNPFGIYNSIFLNFLCEFCPKFQMLTLLLRLWAKRNEYIICYLGMNSYTFTMLVLFYFQHEKILLPITKLGINFSDHYFVTDPDSFKQLIRDKCQALVCDTELSIFDLLRRFFSFYAQFDYYQFIISTRLGRPIRKDDNIDVRNDFDITIGLCVEDPFELERNISKNVQLSKIIQFVQHCEELSKKDGDYFCVGQNFLKFIDKNHSNQFRILKTIYPCLCLIRSQMKSNDKNFQYNFMAHFGDIIMKNFTEFYENGGKISTEGLKRYRLIEMNGHVSSELLKEFLRECLGEEHGKLAIPICDFTFEMKKRKPKEKIWKKSIKKFDPNLPGPSNELSNITDEIMIDNNDPPKTLSNGRKKKNAQRQDNNLNENADDDNEEDDDETKTEIFQISLMLIQIGKNFNHFILKGNPSLTSRLCSIIQRKLCSCRSKQSNKEENINNNNDDENVDLAVDRKKTKIQQSSLKTKKKKK